MRFARISSSSAPEVMFTTRALRWMVCARHVPQTVRAGSLALAILLLATSPLVAQYTQQGAKLVGSGGVGRPQQGAALDLSSDGSTVIIGGRTDVTLGDFMTGLTGDGAAWVFARAGGVWTQQGSKLVGSGAVGQAVQGLSVSISRDGNTAIVGGPEDNDGIGAAWVWTRNAGVWTQQGPKLVATGIAGPRGGQGTSVSISDDGDTAVVGVPGDANGVGAVVVWSRSGGVWTQGPKLVGAGSASSYPVQGRAVAISGDGSTILVGGPGDGAAYTGAAWVWTRTGGVWSQQGPKLVGTASFPNAVQGSSVSLSYDGDVAAVGGPRDNGSAGAVWMWKRSGGVWSQDGAKLVGSGAVGVASQGTSVALSGDGRTLAVGGPQDDAATGATWVFRNQSGSWSQSGSKLVGTGSAGRSFQGTATAVSADGNTVLSGGDHDNNGIGAAWVFINAASIPLASPWMLAVLAGVLALLGVLMSRR